MRGLAAGLGSKADIGAPLLAQRSFSNIRPDAPAAGTAPPPQPKSLHIVIVQWEIYTSEPDASILFITVVRI